MNNYLDYILYQNFVNHEDTERAELSHAIAESSMPSLWNSMKVVKAVPGEPIELEVRGMLPPDQWEAWLSPDDFEALKLPAGEWIHVAMSWPPYPVTPEMLQHLKWVDMYKAQGKRYPSPRRRRSKARMAKKWRDRV